MAESKEPKAKVLSVYELMAMFPNEQAASDCSAVRCQKCKTEISGASWYLRIDFYYCPNCERHVFRKGDFVPPDFEEKIMVYAASLLKD